MSPSQRPKTYGLKRNHGCETPGSLVFVDTEANETVIREEPRKAFLSFRLGCATYLRFERGKVSRREAFDFHDWQEFWTWLETKQSKHRPLWVFGHNIGFDLTLLHFWESIQLSRYRVGYVEPEKSGGILSGDKKWRGTLCCDGFPFFVYSLGPKGLVKFVDTLNYFPMSLEKIGAEIGFPKLEWPGFDAPDSVMLPYCRRDVDVTEKLMVDTLRGWLEADGGVWQPTAAMLALTSFRHKLPSPPKGKKARTIYYDDRKHYEPLERRAFHGGQVTCFYVGPVHASNDVARDVRKSPRLDDRLPPVGPLYLLDVRSLYPSVMRTHRFPCQRLQRRREVRPLELRDEMLCFGAIALVAIASDHDEYTLRTESGQLQATGRFETVLCGPELLRALESGHVERVIEVQTYRMDNLFREWVDDWMRVRDKGDDLGDKVRSHYAKMILNSLQGKLAQAGEHWVDRPGITPSEAFGHFSDVDFETGKVLQYRAVCNQTQERVPGAAAWYTFPAISAYITAHGREHMRWLRGLCPVGTVLYQATDSLLVTQEGYFALEGAGLIQDRELGYLQVKKVAPEGEVLGCNQYRIGDGWVRSGHYRKAEKLESGGYRYTQFEGLKSILASQPDGTVTTEVLTLREVGKYQKGTIDNAGWMSWPVLGKEEVPF